MDNATADRVNLWRRMGARLAVVICLPTMGCSLLPHAASVSDPPTLYVWPESRCPSLNVNAGALAVAGENLLGGDLIGAAVGAIASSLTAAAAADKAGYQVSSNSATFYQSALWDPAKKTYQPQAPFCYVIALAKPSATQGTDWCTDPDFKSSLGASCTNSPGLITSLSKNQGLFNPPDGTLPLTVPSFYAEIELQSSAADATANYFVVKPQIAAIYYPHSLLGGVFEEGRSKQISITINFINPTPLTATDYYKASTVGMLIYNIKPGKTISISDVSNNTQTAWTLVPIEKVPAGVQYKNNDGVSIGGPFRPINITATVHELGDPNVFLQALALSFASTSSTSGITTALGNAVLPQGQLAQKQNDSTLQSNIGKYYAAVSSYQTACATLQSDKNNPTNASKIPADKSSLESAQYNVQSAYTAASASALQSTVETLPAQQTLTCP